METKAKQGLNKQRHKHHRFACLMPNRVDMTTSVASHLTDELGILLFREIWPEDL